MDITKLPYLYSLVSHCSEFIGQLPVEFSFTEKVKQTVKFLDENNFEWGIPMMDKNNARANSSFARANLEYYQNKFQDAIIHYLESISCAPKNSEIFAQAYAKCAQICFKMERYVDCLKNIELAEQHGLTYSNDSLKTKCLDLLSQSENLDVKFGATPKLSYRQNKILPSFAYCLEYVPGN